MSGYIGPQPVPQATQHREAFTATASQTSFATAGYTPQFIDVYLNGIKLASEDYTATNGSDVVLATGAAVGDILEYVAYTPFEVANQTFTGTTTTAALTVTGAFTSKGIDDNAAATAMTIDASRNVMVGQTSVNYNTVGASLASNGTIRGCVDGGLVGAFNRKTSDGTIVNFYKDGTTVGSIGSFLGPDYLTIGNTTGLVMGADGVSPWNVTTNSARTDTINLGSAGQRFKDAYLSGGVYLGGSVAANKLDDYEEGAWTPVLVGASATPSYTLTIANGWYVKVGSVVTVSMDWRGDNVSGGSGDYYFSGLPFLADSTFGEATGSVRLYTIGGYNPQCAVYGGTALAIFVNQAVTNSVWRWGTVGDIAGSTKIVAATMTYRTNA
jgi:hypothetical protein